MCFIPCGCTYSSWHAIVLNVYKHSSAVRLLRSLRLGNGSAYYSDNQSEYFLWLIPDSNIVLMHPYLETLKMLKSTAKTSKMTEVKRGLNVQLTSHWFTRCPPWEQERTARKQNKGQPDKGKERVRYYNCQQCFKNTVTEISKTLYTEFYWILLLLIFFFF